MSPNDYLEAIGHLEFATGETEKTVEVTIIDDGEHEPDESFTVQATNVLNATVGGITKESLAHCNGGPKTSAAIRISPILSDLCELGLWQLPTSPGRPSDREYGLSLSREWIAQACLSCHATHRELRANLT